MELQGEGYVNDLNNDQTGLEERLEVVPEFEPVIAGENRRHSDVGVHFDTISSDLSEKEGEVVPVSENGREEFDNTMEVGGNGGTTSLAIQRDAGDSHIEGRRNLHVGASQRSTRSKGGGSVHKEIPANSKRKGGQGKSKGSR